MSSVPASSYYAILISAALILIAAGLVRAIPVDSAYLRATFTIEHVELLGMFDNRGQQWAHRTLVILLGLLALALWVARPTQISDPPVALKNALDQLITYGGIPLLAVFVPMVALGGRPLLDDHASFHGSYALFPSLSIRTQLLLAAVGLCSVYVFAKLNAHEKWTRLFTTIGLLGCVAYMLGLGVLGIFRQPSFADFSPGLLAGVEWHYSGSVASADRIGLGERLGTVPIHSSLLPTVLLGVWQQTNGILDFGGHIRLLAVLQTGMLLLIALAYRVWYQSRPVAFITALLLALPWMQPLQAAVLYPNQSSWRFFGLCAGAALLAIAHTRNLRTLAPLLGLGGGFAVLWNLETGIALNLAYMAFLVLRHTQPAAPAAWKSGMRYVGGSLTAGLAFCLLVRVGLGYWPDWLALAGSFPLIGDFAKGYGGLPFRAADPLAALVFAHALLLSSRGLLDWSSSLAVDSRDCCRIAFAVLLVVWAAYYFKGPHPWNLWSFLMIYGFLVRDLFAQPRRASESVTWRLVATPRLMLLGIVVVPAIIATNFVSSKALAVAARQPQCPSAHVVSGVCLPADIAVLAREKVAVLLEQAERGTILYFSADSYLMPLLSGIKQPLTQRDAFSDSILASDFGKLVSDVVATKSHCILFDDPKSYLSGYDAHRRFYGRLRLALADTYERREERSGWEIYCTSGSK